MIVKRMSKRRRGALAMVALAGMVPVSAMMSANLNTSQMIDDRRQTQDAADALATTHGAWTARALNIISMNNVTAAQLLTVAVGSEALILTTTELTGGAIAATGAIKAHEFIHCPPRSPFPANLLEAVVWSGPCVVWHEAVNLPATMAAARAADIKSDFDPIHGVLTARKALQAIDGMNKALAQRHPNAMDEIAKGYHQILDINDHHFADPCNGPYVARCRQTNSTAGMALPLEDAEPGPLGGVAKMMQVMRLGQVSVETTFNTRGFTTPLKGPMLAGGSRTFPELKYHINHVTEIGTALYDFRRFYQSRISHMPRHPTTGPGSGTFPTFLPPPDPRLPPRQFRDRKTNLADIVREALEFADPFNRIFLTAGRNFPQVLFGFDRHTPRGYLISRTQRRAGPNAFTNNYELAYGTIMLGAARGDVPIDFDLFGGRGVIYAAPVPETFQLPGIEPLNPVPPTEIAGMDDEFYILALTQKELARRLGTAVMTSPVDGHTGYGQAGVFNPDGATLYTQNWQTRLMPATRMDDPVQASRDLGRQATESFDRLAEDLGHVSHRQSWERVHAH